MPVKPRYLKQLGTELIERYPEAFSEDFEHNKRAVSALTTIESKPVRNRVAGYVTRRTMRSSADGRSGAPRTEYSVAEEAPESPDEATEPTEERSEASEEQIESIKEIEHSIEEPNQ